MITMIIIKIRILMLKTAALFIVTLETVSAAVKKIICIFNKHRGENLMAIKFDEILKRLACNLMIATKHEIMQHYIGLSESGKINNLESVLHNNLPEKFFDSDLDTKYIIYAGIEPSKITVFKRYSSGAINLGAIDRSGIFEDKPDYHLVLVYGDITYESVNGFLSLDAFDVWSKEPYAMEFNKVVTNTIEQMAIDCGKIELPTLSQDFYL